MKKIFKYLIISISSLGLTSCLDDKGYTDIVNSESNAPVVSLGLNYIDLFPIAIPISPSETISIPVTAARASSDLTATFVVDPAAVDAYNTAHEDDEDYEPFIPLPESTYTIPTLTVTIPQGTLDADLDVKVNSSNLTLTDKYMLPLKLVSISGDEKAVLASNLSEVLLYVQLKNAYDGVYTIAGTIERNSAAGPDLTLGGTYKTGQQISATTISANGVSIVPVWIDGSTVGGIATVNVNVNPTTNAATVTSTLNATLKNTPDKTNSYDPATKTFTLAFDWGAAPNTRKIVMTMKYKGVRP